MVPSSKMTTTYLHILVFKFLDSPLPRWIGPNSLIMPMWRYVTSELYVLNDIAISTRSWITPGEARCPAARTRRKSCGAAPKGATEVSCKCPRPTQQSYKYTKSDADPPLRKASLDEISPSWHFDSYLIIVFMLLWGECSQIRIPNFDPYKLWRRMSTYCCLKPLSFGVICHA